MRPAAVLTALWLSAAAAGCAGGGAAPPEGPAAMTKILEAAAATGARPFGEVLWYNPKNLYDYINGQAEEYLEAGFVRLAHSEWKAAGSAGDAYVELDLYDMASPAGAAAVMPPVPDDHAVALGGGVRAYRQGSLMEFVAGRYYVRLTARLDLEGQGALMEGLARAVAEAVSAAGP